ncbi:hypothetical protein SVAN01_01577 [Stagonosporopsis vannaccii]|nr:hypothetical protein SVAN01_01577 [Stagonosporopsis vannaccii]
MMQRFFQSDRHSPFSWENVLSGDGLSNDAHDLEIKLDRVTLLDLPNELLDFIARFLRPATLEGASALVVFNEYDIRFGDVPAAKQYMRQVSALRALALTCQRTAPDFRPVVRRNHRSLPKGVWSTLCISCVILTTLQLEINFIANRIEWLTSPPLLPHVHTLSILATHIGPFRAMIVSCEHLSIREGVQIFLRHTVPVVRSLAVDTPTGPVPVAERGGGKPKIPVYHPDGPQNIERHLLHHMQVDNDT